jgi:hypothetical protein
VGVNVVAVGGQGLLRLADVTAAMASAGAATRVVSCPDPADRARLDRALDDCSDGRLVIAADVAALAAVLRRMWRRGELLERETAWLPLGPVPPFLVGQGMPAALGAAATLAVQGSARTVGLLADDSGGLVLDSAELRPWLGRRVWVRAFVDDERVCDGPVTGLRVSRPSPGALRVTVLGRFGRTRARVDGRAAQLACAEAALSSDGVSRERPRRKRTWWNEPDLWRLALPAPGDPPPRPGP